MRSFSILLSLIMLMSLFSCAQKRASLPDETTQSTTTPEITTSETVNTDNTTEPGEVTTPSHRKPKTISFKDNTEADSLTDEEKQNIFDWYVYTYDLHNDKDLKKIFWVIRKHYGNHDGYVVLFDRPLGQSTESPSDKTIGGYRFKSSIRFVIRLFKDGKFVTLNDETIEKGLISKEAVGRIWEYHNSIQRPEYKQYDIDIPDNAEPNKLSDETMAKLRAAFKEWAEPRPNVNVDDIVHYGNYDGTAVFFFPDNSIKTPSVYKSPDGITIEHRTYFDFVIYKDGYFDFACHPSFLQKYLTTESIAEIAAYHKTVSSSE